MLNAQPRPEGKIIGVERIGDVLKLPSENGILQIEPKRGDIIRVRFSANPLTDRTGLGICCDTPFSDWDYVENIDDIVLTTGKALLRIDKSNGVIRWFDAEGKQLLSEEKRILEGFEACPPSSQDDWAWQDVATPDGTKRKLVRKSGASAETLYHTWLHFRFHDGEHIYGLGQAEEGVLNLRGTTQYLHQANRKIAIPMMLSSRMWGILWATDSTAIFQDTQYGSYFYTEADEEMDYYFIAGSTFDEIISGYRSLTGKAALLPRWAFGYIQSQERYETQRELLEIAAEYRKRRIGLDCIVLDWCSWPDGQWGQKSFDSKRFGDMTGTLNTMHADDIRFMLSIWPNMAEGCDDHRAFAERNLLLPKCDIYNAFSDEARRLYWQQVKDNLLIHGVDAWWCDSSEPFTPEWTHMERPDPSAMYHEYVDTVSNHIPVQKANAFALCHARTLCEGQRSAGSAKRVVNLTRSAWTGQQRYGAILWSGDIEATWETLRRQIAAGLNFCASGLPYWTLDIGAFFVKRGGQWFWSGDYDDGFADPRYGELFVRWYQLGAFLPIFRGHGTDFRRELWLAGETDVRFYDALLAANRLRYRLLPYLYSLAGAVWFNDGTLMRMLAFDFPQDEHALDIDDEFMLGPALLVCPVTNPMLYGEDRRRIDRPDCTRKVYLPSGADWYDYYTNRHYAGGQTILADAPLDRIPLFVRAGSILPVTGALQSTAEYDIRDVELFVYPGADGSFDFYDDAGDGYGYERGEYSLWTIRWKEHAHNLVIDHRASACECRNCDWKPKAHVVREGLRPCNGPCHE